MKNFLSRTIAKLAGRAEKIRRRLELIRQLEEINNGPLRRAIEEAETERARIQDIVSGVFVQRAHAVFNKATQPVKDELNTLHREIINHPPAAIVDFLDELRYQELRTRQLLDAEDIRRQDLVGRALEVDKPERYSVLAALEAIRGKIARANGLALEDLSAAELSKRLDAIKCEPLPEIKPAKFTRENGDEEFEMVVA